jgi:uroporphyrinogen-III synthase
MSRRVAVTRAAPENARTAARLRERGAVAVLAPLLEIELRPFDTDLANAQALLFTSSNGVHAFTQRSQARAAQVLAIGDATAQAARGLGFANVFSANGDVAALAALAARTLDPKRGKLLHIGGAHLAGDLSGALIDAGFSVERRIAYEARTVTQLPGEFSVPLDLVLFHSARAAGIFVQLGAPNSHAMDAACLSGAVADALGTTRWRRIIVAPRPREEELLTAALAA